MKPGDLIGEWTLVSSTQTRNGVLSKTYGDQPLGQVQFTAGGRMSAFLMNACWKDIGENATQQTELFFSYAGRWQIKGNELHHFVEFCSLPSRIGTTFVRTIRVINDAQIELITAPEVSSSGNVYEAKLVWRKCA